MGAIDAFFGDVGKKLWAGVKFAVPGMAAWEVLKWLIGSWWDGVVTDLQAKIRQQMEILHIDLSPPPGLGAFFQKANVILPLSEAWHYLLLYLGLASVVLGIKWMRNLIPGLK